jgi:patatin-like phospholipase/acyl hydrolase
MKLFGKIVSLAAITTVESKNYNILSLDGGMYKGYLTAGFVDYMEKRAYYTATRDSCIEPRLTERVAMSELFDMISGSETGAIISTSLVIANDDAATNGT